MTGTEQGTQAKPRIPARVIAVLVFGMGLNALAQVPQFIEGWGGDPPLLSFEQFLVGAAGVHAGYLAWRDSAPAWIATLVWGALSAILVGTLGPVLELERDAWPGLYYGAAAILAIAACFSWYLRRAARTGR